MTRAPYEGWRSTGATRGWGIRPGPPSTPDAPPTWRWRRRVTRRPPATASGPWRPSDDDTDGTRRVGRPAWPPAGAARDRPARRRRRRDRPGGVSGGRAHRPATPGRFAAGAGGVGPGWCLGLTRARRRGTAGDARRGAGAGGRRRALPAGRADGQGRPRPRGRRAGDRGRGRRPPAGRAPGPVDRPGCPPLGGRRSRRRPNVPA